MSLKDHAGQNVCCLEIVLLQQACGTHAHLVCVTLQHRYAPAAPQHWDGPHIHGNTGGQGIVAGLADLMTEIRHHDLMIQLIGDLLAYDVVFQRRRSGHRADLRDAGENLTVGGIIRRNPQQQIREGQVTEQMPLALKGQEPLIVRKLIGWLRPHHGPTLPLSSLVTL